MMLFYFVSFISVVVCSASVGGPVFVNPANAAANVQPTSQNAAGQFVTQTVYGFLDFTTTIGNTVMVFSPQSAAPKAPTTNAPPAPQVAVVNVIDSKPPSTEKAVTSIIKPSKTTSTEKSSDGSEKKVFSVVQVQANQAPSPVFSSKVEVKEVIASKVNVVEAQVSSVVQVQNPVVSSIVEVVAASPIKKETQNVITKVEVVTQQQQLPQHPIFSSKVEVYEESSSSIVTPPPKTEIELDVEPAVIIGNNIGEPEYDFLSRQPSEVVEETYKVINLKPSSKFHLKPRASQVDKKNTKRPDGHHPTGLVTKLGGTVVKDGVTTVHETSVIGTYISGKYAQVLQSTSHLLQNNQKPKINPSPTLRILKTAAPAIGKGHKHHKHLEPTPAAAINEEASVAVDFPAQNQNNNIRSTRKPGGSFKNRAKAARPREEESEAQSQPQVQSTHGSHKKKNRNSQPGGRSSKQQNTSHRNSKQAKRKHSSKISSVSVHSEPTTATPGGKRYNSRRNKQTKATTPAPESSPTGGFTRRGFKPKSQAQIQATSAESPSSSTSVYKFKLNRSPGRWQYKTTAKPRVTIRKQEEDGTTPTQSEAGSNQQNDPVTPQARSDDGDSLVGSESIASIVDDESSTENKVDNPYPLETIKVEISTPPDFKDIYYEIATIKSPYTFQVGSVKNTRYITVTSTFEKSFDNTIDQTISPTASEPLTENILATSSNYEKDNNFLDSSIATLPPVYLASDMETPPLETMIESFSTTQTMLKTHILPVVRGNETSSQTLVQTYIVTRMVTATKTLPPMEAYHFIPSKTLNEFNSHLDEAGSELHLELEFGDNNEQDEDGHVRKAFPPDLDLANIGSNFDLSDVERSRLESHLRSKKAHQSTPKPILQEALPTPSLSPEQLQQLALLRLLNPQAAQAAQGQVITTSKPVIKIETLYESHVIPIINGANTILSTISKPVGTVTKTDFEIGTSVLPGLPQIPQIPIPPIPQVQNPLFPQQQQFALTSSPVIQNTIVTQTQSKILKLTFGAKTAYTTIFSTKLVPTLLTSYMTTSVPVQPTAAFPGFFPAPYPPFPYVG